MIRKIFSDCAKKAGYELLPEQGLVRNNGSETFFVGASIMAHMDIFEQQETKKYYTIQRVFSGTRLEDVGKYPLATPFEVMLSIFHVNDSSVAASIDFTLQFLTESVNISKDDIFFLVPDAFDIKKTLAEKGMSENNIIVWGEPLPLHVGKDYPTGVYLKMFFRYKHGVIPCGTLGFLPSEKGINVDSAFFLERLDFVRNNQDSMYDGVFFEDVLGEINKCEWLSKFPDSEKYLWANHLRSIIILLNDGANSGGKGSSHVLTKLIRGVVFSAISNGEIGRLTEVILGAVSSLEKLGYEIKESGKIVATMETQISKTYNQANGIVKKYTEWIQTEQNCTERDIKKWNDEKGLPYSIMINFAEQFGKQIIIPQQPKRFWFRNECFSFDKAKKIENIREFLINSELKRMAK